MIIIYASTFGLFCWVEENLLRDYRNMENIFTIRGHYRNIMTDKSEIYNRIHPKVLANLDSRMATIM